MFEVPFKREIPRRLREYLEHFMRVIPCDQEIRTIQLHFLIFVEIMIILGAISERERERDLQAFYRNLKSRFGRGLASRGWI